MKSYNSIPHWNKGPFGEKTIAFDKLDGSNLRFEYGKKRGWYKFGTRNVMITEKDENFGHGITLFLNKYGDELSKIFEKKYRNVESVVVFAEYFGKNSFAGQHVVTDIKDVILFDVNLYKRGIVSPYEFMDNFGHLDIPKVIYEGIYDMEFIDSIRSNIYNLTEGVVAKSIVKTKKDGEEIYMSKIKCNHWLKKVKEKLGNKALLDEVNGDKELFKSI